MHKRFLMDILIWVCIGMGFLQVLVVWYVLQMPTSKKVEIEIYFSEKYKHPAYVYDSVDMDALCEKYSDIEPYYTYEDYDLLTRLITAEAGAYWCSDEMMYFVGSVALNRVNSNRFPNTLYEVIHQDGQYSCVGNKYFNGTPCDRAYMIAEDLLVNGSVLPDNVVWQANFAQGKGTYKKVQNMYFCY